MVMGPTGALACSEYGTWSCTDSPCGGGGHGVTGVPTVPPPHAPAQPGPPTTPLRGLRRRSAPGSQQARGAWGSRPGPAAPLGDRGEAPGPAAPRRPPCTAAIATPGSHADASSPPCTPRGEGTYGHRRMATGRGATVWPAVWPARSPSHRGETEARRLRSLPKATQSGYKAQAPDRSMRGPPKVPSAWGRLRPARAPALP